MTERHRYVIDVAAQRTSEQGPREQSSAVRMMTEADVDALPDLILAAYAGTIDDEGEGLPEAEAEIADWLAEGGSIEHSRVAVENGAIVGAALVAVNEHGAFIAFVITAPAAKRRGYGRAVVRSALGALAADHDSVALWITDGNTASERLFAGLGAIRTPRP